MKRLPATVREVNGMNNALSYDFNHDLDKDYLAEDYPWIEFCINGAKYDVNSKYVYGGFGDE